MTTQFTPGPWKVSATFEVRSDAGIPVLIAEAKRSSSDLNPINHQAAANARLIASAPALYDALKAMVAAFEDGEPLTVDATTYKTALAALSQAEGK